MTKIGDKVRCRLYNTGDRCFYGGLWESEILEIDHNHQTSKDFVTPYRVKHKPNVCLVDPKASIWLTEREIKH